jgi:SnoaL-like domain
MEPHPYGQALADRDLDRLVALLADDVVFHTPDIAEPGFRGRDAVATVLEMLVDVVTDVVIHPRNRRRGHAHPRQRRAGARQAHEGDDGARIRCGGQDPRDLGDGPSAHGGRRVRRGDRTATRRAPGTGSWCGRPRGVQAARVVGSRCGARGVAPDFVAQPLDRVRGVRGYADGDDFALPIVARVIAATAT